MPDPIPYGLPPGEADTPQGVPPRASSKPPSTGADYGLPPGETTAQYDLPPGESSWLGGMMPSHVPAQNRVTEIIPGMRAEAIGRGQSPLKDFGQQLFAHGKQSSQELTAGLLRIGGKVLPIGEGPDTGTPRGRANNPLLGAANTIEEDIKENPIPAPKTSMGSIGATIGGFAPNLTPLAPLTMGSQMYEQGYNALSGEDELTRTRAASAMGTIGAVVGGAGAIGKNALPVLKPILGRFPALWDALSTEVKAGASNGPVVSFLKNIVAGGTKTSADFVAMNAANDAIQESARTSGGNPLKAATDMSRRLEDVKTGFLFHAVPALLGAASKGIANYARRGPEGKGVEQPPIQSTEASPNPGPARTPDIIRAEGLKAIKRGDQSKARELRIELENLQNEKPVTQQTPLDPNAKIELDPLRRFGRDAYPYEDVLPEISPEDTIIPKEDAPAVEEPGAPNPPEMIPAKASDELAGKQLEQQDITTQLREQRIKLQSELDAANSELEYVKQSGRRGSSGVYREALARVARATADMAANDEQLMLHTGKSYDELQGEPSGVTPEGMNQPHAWDNTKKAWDELSAELGKPGNERGAIGDQTNPEVMLKVSNLVKAAIKDGYRNASEWLADMKRNLGEGFDKFYQAIGGLEGANKLWQEHAHGNAYEIATQTPPVDKVSEGLAKMLTRAAEREAYHYQALDQIEKIMDSGESPYDVAKRFFTETYPKLDYIDKKKFDKQWFHNYGDDVDFSRDDAQRVTGNPEAGPHDWMDLPKDADYSKYDGDPHEFASTLESSERSILPWMNYFNESYAPKDIVGEALPRTTSGYGLIEGEVLHHPSDEPNAGLGKHEYKGGDIADMFGLGSGLEATMNTLKRSLDLPLDADPTEVASAVMERIGHLGASVKETVVRIMSKIKGITRDVATAIAEHLHQAVSGSRESQLGMARLRGNGSPEESLPLLGGREEIAPEENTETPDKYLNAYQKEGLPLLGKGEAVPPKERPVRAKDFLTPEQIDAEKASRNEYKKNLEAFIPGDSPEAKAQRAAAWKNYVAPWKASIPPDEPTSNETSFQYRPATQYRDGSIPDALNKFVDQIWRRPMPSLVDEAGARAGDIWRKRDSETATAVFKVNRNIKEQLVHMASQPKSVREMVADELETPGSKYKINDPELAKTVSFVKSQSKEMGQALVDAGVIKSYVENYLHHSFKETPEQIQLAIQKKSPTGNLGYLIERHGPDTYAIGKELGLTPKETNPFKTFFDDFVNKQKFFLANRAISDMMGEGLITRDPQPGFVKLNDYLASAVNKSNAGEGGEYYAPKSVADLLNNHMGKGFESNIGFRALRALNNSMAHVEQGLSFFHGTFIMRDISNTLLGSGITGVMRGDFREGMKQIALGATPIYGQKVLISRGSQLRSIMAGEAEGTAKDAGTIRDYQLGGGHPELDPEYINDTMLHAREAWEKAKDVKLDKLSRLGWGGRAAAEIPFSVIESFARPVMEQMVPNAKMGAFERMWEIEKKSLPENATEAQRAARARQVINSIDDRMGQLIYSNLHLPNGLRQAVTLATRAGGWAIGSLRAIYGAGFDTANAVKMLSQDAAGKVGLLSPETQKTIEMARGKNGIWSKKDYFTQRMGYAVASAISMAITNGLITHYGTMARNAYYKKQGEKDADTTPHGMDYVFPRIGKDHYSVAGYEKEAVEQYKIIKNIILHHDASEITDYMSQKASPIINLSKELYPPGTDWKGNKISPGRALLSKYLPYSAADLGTPSGDTTSTKIQNAAGPIPLTTAGRLVGFTPAPKSLTQTDAENQVLKILHQDKHPLSQQEADHEDFVNRMALYYKNDGMDVVNDAKERGLLTTQDMNRIRKMSKDTDLLKGVMKGWSISPKDALDIYKNYATPEEQKKLHQIMIAKKSQARRSTAPADMEQYRKDWSVIK